MATDTTLTLEQLARVTARIDAGMPRARALAEASIALPVWEAGQEAWLTRMAQGVARQNLELCRRYASLLMAERQQAEIAIEVARRKLDGPMPVYAEARLSPIALPNVRGQAAHPQERPAPIEQPKPSPWAAHASYAAAAPAPAPITPAWVPQPPAPQAPANVPPPDAPARPQRAGVTAAFTLDARSSAPVLPFTAAPATQAARLQPNASSASANAVRDAALPGAPFTRPAGNSRPPAFWQRIVNAPRAAADPRALASTTAMFQPTSTPSSPPPGMRLTIEQLAWLHARSELPPHTVPAARQQLGLTEVEQAQEDARYHELFGRDRPLFAQYQQLLARYRRMLR